jgi:cytosine deaminase
VTTENDWLREAVTEAEKSWSQGGIPIGSVLVTSDGVIVGRGHNERVQTGDPTAHAEVVAFRNAGRRRDWGDLILVSTLSPCIMCTGTALLFGIKRVIIGENKNFLGAEALMCSNGVQVDVLNDKGCIELMDRMKREKPDLWAEDIGK